MVEGVDYEGARLGPLGQSQRVSGGEVLDVRLIPHCGTQPRSCRNVVAFSPRLADVIGLHGIRHRASLTLGSERYANDLLVVPRID